MRQVYYTGGSFLTGDEVAGSLLAYAVELANVERAATVFVPTPEHDDVELLLGPASELLSVHVDDQRPDPDGAAFLEDLARRTTELQRGRIG